LKEADDVPTIRNQAGFKGVNNFTNHRILSISKILALRQAESLNSWAKTGDLPVYSKSNFKSFVEIHTPAGTKIFV